MLSLLLLCQASSNSAKLEGAVPLDGMPLPEECLSEEVLRMLHGKLRPNITSLLEMVGTVYVCSTLLFSLMAAAMT